jgi:hypothetical protein
MKHVDVQNALGMHLVKIMHKKCTDELSNQNVLNTSSNQAGTSVEL